MFRAPRTPASVVLVLAFVGGSLSLAGQASAATPDGPRAQRVAAALAAPSRTLDEIPLPSTEPGAFVVTVLREGEARTLRLARHSLRDPAAFVRVVGANGRSVDRALPAPRTYRGFVDEDPSAVVVASLRREGLVADIVAGADEDWSIRPVSLVDPAAARSTHVVFRSAEAPEVDFACGPPRSAPWAGDIDAAGADGDVAPRDGATPAGDDAPGHGGAPGSGSADDLDLPAGGLDHDVDGTARPFPRIRPDTCGKLADIAFDADFEYFLLQGGTVAGVVATIEEHMNLVDFFYTRDAAITYRLTAFVVRTAPFYTPTSGGDLLDQFRAEWNTTQSAIPRDMAHLMTDKGPVIEFGGLAWVGVVCTDLAYGWSLDSAGIVGHEVGHNWASGHCHDTTPCNNMCGACLFIGPVTRDIIIGHAESRTCLDELAGFLLSPVPPYVTPEALSLRRSAFDAPQPYVLDVLGNDEDGNCQEILLSQVDGSSTRGGTVSVSAGTGPGGRDEVVYELPDVAFLGDDGFDYFVVDGTGRKTKGRVSINVRALDVGGAWRLDETSGSVAADSSGHERDGAVVGAPVWTTGQVDGGLEFNGVNDLVTAPALDLDTDEVTITAWVNRNGNQLPYTGLVMSRGGSSDVGLHFGLFGELRYTWFNDNATWGWNSGLTTPSGQWVFVALTVQADQATLYLYDGTMQSATNVHPHAIAAWDGDVTLGADPVSPLRRFKGTLDGVRIYDHALSAAEVDEVRSLGGRASAPRPADGGRMIDSVSGVAWLGSPLATDRDVYFGTDYLSVRDADTGSPEFQGNQTATTFLPGAVSLGTRYFWRVDERIGPTVLPGRVWQFDPARRSRWALDETSGLLASEDEGTISGIYLGNPQLNLPGAAPHTGTSVDFDGSGDAVQIPALDLNSNTVTITTWLRRDGSQSPFDGLVFTRAGNSAAGLNFGDSNELRYHWNNSGSTWAWNSGLVVPDATWVFAALVVEPDKATIYLGDGGVLTTAVNTVTHAIEEFDGVMYFGRDPFGGREFNGRLDDVRIYEAALTPLQVEKVYEGEL